MLSGSTLRGLSLEAASVMTTRTDVLGYSQPELSKLAVQRPSGRRKLLHAFKRTRASEIELVAIVATLSIHLHPSRGKPLP
jgi:hypothetical protein